MKHKSQWFKTPRALNEERNRLWGNMQTPRTREWMVRSFYNGLPTRTPEEAESDDSPDVVNHLMGYRNIKRYEDAIFSIYSGTNSMLEIKVDTGVPESDTITGQRISRIINEAIYHSGKFENLWQSVSGELPLTGKAPLVFNRRGWCPRLAPNLLLPENASPVAEDIPYAYAPYELTYTKLKELEASVKGSESKFVDLATVKLLLGVLKEQIEGKGTATYSDKGKETVENPLDERIFTDTRTSIKAWKYYEVYFDGKKKVVSETLFTERINLTNSDNRAVIKAGDDGEERIVSYIPKAFESPENWLHTLVVDSQIGGLKTYATARGLAEITYPSDTDAEELLNEQIAGDKLRARPKFRMTAEANPKQVASWRPHQDSMTPPGVESVQMFAAGNVLAPLQLLTQNTSRLTGSSVSNAGREGGELRQQAVQRQGEDGSMQSNRMSAVHTPLDRLLAEIVRRFLTITNDPGGEGYNDIAWARQCLDKYQIPYKKLAEMEFGRFKWIKVRSARVIGSGDRESELFVADQMMKNIGEFDPQVRPLIRQKWLALVSHDPTLAEAMVRLPEVILSNQRVVAENEFDTILRRASIGSVLPVGVEDIHEDHAQTHLIDLQAFLTELSTRQPTEMDLRRIAGGVDHITKHLQAMADMPSSAGAAKVFQQQLQQLVTAAEEIIAKVQEQQQQPAGMTPKEQADFVLKQGQLELAAQKQGLAEAQFEEIVKSRQSRARQGDRKQYANEVKTVEQLKLAKENQKLQEKKIQNDARKKATTDS
jgi:hypothetical protein